MRWFWAVYIPSALTGLFFVAQSAVEVVSIIHACSFISRESESVQVDRFTRFIWDARSCGDSTKLESSQ